MRLLGATNFRPLAGLKPVLFRSDHLGALDADDARQVRELGIRRVLDFRGVHERATALCALPEVTVHSLAIEPTIVQKLSELLAQGHAVAPADVVAHMEDTYRGFVRENTHRFREFFGHLLESDDPTVFHCTAGKDRTGFAAALLQRALGRPEEEIQRDYLMTNERLELPAAFRNGLPRDVMAVLWRVQPEFLRAADAEAERRYGSLDGYLREGLGLGEAERERLRALYLPPQGAAG